MLLILNVFSFQLKVVLVPSHLVTQEYIVHTGKQGKHLILSFIYQVFKIMNWFSTFSEAPITFSFEVFFPFHLL